MSDTLSGFIEKVGNSIDLELEKVVDGILPYKNSELKEIFRYHLELGEKEGRQGKRIRPLLTLLCAEGAGANWKSAIPAAAAIELVHNFSLIHDDIEDKGESRRGKVAVWRKWGLSKGLNAGDAMFSAAFAELNRINNTKKPLLNWEATKLLSKTCLDLTEGQQLDIDFESRDKVTKSDYFLMIEGKTAALIACCARMGALIGGLDEEDQEKYSMFGKHLGIAFQIYDDWLGIWGDPSTTGKSSSSDLIERKKSLPVVRGLENSKRFMKRWDSGSITESDAEIISRWLIEDGIKEMVETEYHLWTEKALDDLKKLTCKNEILSMLEELTYKLLTRVN